MRFVLPASNAKIVSVWLRDANVIQMIRWLKQSIMYHVSYHQCSLQRKFRIQTPSAREVTSAAKTASVFSQDASVIRDRRSINDTGFQV